MKRKLGLLAVVLGAATLALAGVLRDVNTSKALMPLPIQPFAPDELGGISTNTLGQNIAANWTVTQALQGERTTIPGVFSGPGFSVDLDKEITNGTNVGTVWSNVDANCNGVVDVLADICGLLASGPPGYEGRASPLTWSEATTAVEGTSDAFLLTVMPPFSWLLRHQVAIGWICIGIPGWPAVPFPSILNTVYAAIPYSPNGSAFVAQTKLGGSPTIPLSNVCLDSPQTSESITNVYNNPPDQGDIDGVCDTGTQACADAGIYGMWTDNTVAIANWGSTVIDVTKYKVNNGPEDGDFRETWEVESTNPDIVAVWPVVTPIPGPVYSEPVTLVVNDVDEQDMTLSITCNAGANNEWGLVVLKNFLSPIPPTEDTYLDDNAMVFVVLVKCGTVTGTLVDKEVSLIKAAPEHIAITTGGTASVAIDELKANHATTNVLGDEWLVAEVGDVVAPAGPDLTLAWVSAPNPGAVTVTAPGYTTQTPTITSCGTGCIRFLVDEWPGQADVNATLNITCPATTPAGLYPVVVKAIDSPATGYLESKPSDNAQRKVITVRCGGPAADGRNDGDGLYPRWTILQSMGSTSLNKSGDLRKVFLNPPSIPSDSGYVERTIDLQCFWIDSDGGAPAGTDGIISEVESWQDPDLVGVGGLGAIGVIDSDGDCLIDPAYAQPGHPVDLPTVVGTCAKLKYSENPQAVTYSKAQDADCDGLVDGIEKAWGSNPLKADSDDDGADDFVEMFQFTNPVNPDTDGDGYLDRPAGVYTNDGTACDLDGNLVPTDPSVDNCPSVYNPTQLNSDGARRPGGPNIPGGTKCPASATDTVASNPNQDKMGDACDDDDDNDGATDAYELSTIGGKATTNPLNIDSDGDTVNDGAEWRLGTNPNDENDYPFPIWGAADQVYYRGCNISVNGAYASWDQEYDGLEDDIENDPDGDGIICPTDVDSDNGRGTGLPALAEVLDETEAFGFATSITNKDTDGDGCEDWIEIHDLTGDRACDSGDQLVMNRRVARRIDANAISDKIYDVNKDTFLDSGDQLRMNQNNFGVKRWGGYPMCPPEN